MFTISLDTPALARRQPTEAELKKFVLKSLGFDGFETDGLGLWDIFGAPGNSATGGTGYRDVEQIRGWNHTAILAKSLQFALASMSVFCSPEIADLVTGGGNEKYKAASRTSGIEHFQVPQDWVQAPREYRVSRLLRRPNPWTDESLFRFRMSQQIEAHGVCYVLVLPNEDGIPSQLYVIPKTSLTLLPPSTKMPRGGYRTAQLCRYLRSWNQNERPQSLQEMLSWLSNKDFDAKFVIPIGLPSFVWMDDFMNPSSAIADALDTDKEIHRSRRQTLQNQATNGPMFEEEAGYNLQTDERAQLLEEFHARNAGPGNSGKAFWKPKGVQIHNGAYSAREMEFSNSAVESRDAVMGQRMTPSAMVGLGDLTSYASVIGVLKAWSRMSGQPLMRLCAGQLTVGLQHFYDNEADREFMIVMQAGNIDDPETKADERRLALESGTRTVKEWREEDNLEPFGDERDDAIVGTLQQQPPAGGEGAEGLAGLMGGGKPPLPGASGGDKGPANPGIGAAVSGVPAAGSAAGGASQTEKAASALSDLTRAQFKRNRTAILETLDAVETGQMRPKRAKALLQAMGLSPQEADDLLLSVESPPEPEKTAQEQAASFFAKMFAKAAGSDCGANPDGDGFGEGNTCGKEKGEGKAAKSEKPAGKKKRRDIAKDPGQTVRGKTPEEVEEIKRRQRVAGRKAALRKRIEDAWKAAEEAGDDEDALLQRIQENIVLHSKRRLIDDEISLDEFETTHEQLLGKPVDQDEVASWGVKSAPERFDEAIDKAVQEHGVDWHQLRSVADQVWKHHAEFHRMREVAKKEARRITGVSLADVSRIENEGFDYSTIEGFDENARSFAIENPLIGIDPDDPADAVWQLIREPQRRPLPKYDQSIIDDAVGIIQRGEAVPVVAPPKLDIGGDDFVPAHERDDFVPDDDALVTVGDDEDISWNFGKSVADMLFAKWTFIELATVKRSGCGANGPGGGGFQPGNTCGEEDGQESSDEHEPAAPKKESGGRKDTLNAASERLAKQVHSDGGFTYHQPTDSIPEKGFALSILHDRERVFDKLEDVTPDVVADFILDNMDIFEDDERTHFGAWYNAKTDDNPKGDNKVYFDVSVVVDDLDEAFAMAREHGQLGMFDLKTFKTIRTMTKPERRSWRKQKGMPDEPEEPGEADDKPVDGPEELRAQGFGKSYAFGRVGDRSGTEDVRGTGRSEDDRSGSRRPAAEGREKDASAEDVKRWLRTSLRNRLSTGFDFLD